MSLRKSYPISNRNTVKPFRLVNTSLSTLSSAILLHELIYACAPWCIVIWIGIALYQETVTWYKIRRAAQQATHLIHQNKEKSSLTCCIHFVLEDVVFFHHSSWWILYFVIVGFKRPTCITVNQVCNHGDSPEKGSQNKSKKSQFSSILLQLWIIALAILAEITDRVLICWIVTNVSAVRILQDKIANLVSASRIVVALQCKTLIHLFILMALTG